ncbi:HAD family hydrolase [Lactiplantibacillus plajomi]|uniref:HAD family hydrolase n=1 Tax=Lactiplantibacillus plajomi TaxID=1457217 RepID=A0ABV6K610_9LACO|nr:HAD family hydrolase [Lactiplantibacillus plajomi]
MTYQAIMFDIDGTLTNSQPVYTTVMRAVLKEFGRDFSDDDAQLTFPMAAEQALAHLGIEADEVDRFQVRYEAVMADHFTDIKLFPGIETMMAQLPSDVKLGIVTSQRRNEMDTVMAPHAPVMAHMDVTIGADDTPKRKPDPLPLLTALKRVNVTPENALFVGDSLSDEKTAAAANVDFGLAGWGMDPNASHQTVAHHFEHPADIAALYH